MADHAKNHVRHEALVSGVSNTVFNGAIAWLLLNGGPPMSWSGSNSFVVDILATAFILPFIVALIVIPLQKRKLASGKIAAMDFGYESRLQCWVNHLPYSTMANAFLFGIVGICLAAPPPLLGFYLAGVEQITPLHYAIFKGIWAGLMATVLVIPMVMSALRKPTSLGAGLAAE